MARAVITSFPWSRRWWRWISWNSMAKQSVEVASSCSVRRSGEGLPCSRHQRKTSSPAPSSRGEISDRDIVELDGEAVRGGGQFVLGEEERGRAAVLAPPAEDVFAGAEFAGGDFRSGYRGTRWRSSPWRWPVRAR